MDQKHFQEQLNRLNKTFANFYNTERSAIIWREFGSFKGESWTYLVDTVIRKCKSPPTIEELCGFAAELRERLREKERRYEAEDAHDFWSGRLHPEEIRYRMGIIKDRIRGKVPDSDWAEFVKMLKYNADRAEGLL